MSLGAFVEFNSYVVALAFPTIAMGWVFSVWNRGIRRIRPRDRDPEYRTPRFKSPPEDADQLPPSQDAESPRRRHVFEGVSFSTITTKIVLRRY